MLVRFIVEQFLQGKGPELGRGWPGGFFSFVRWVSFLQPTATTSSSSNPLRAKTPISSILGQSNPLYLQNWNPRILINRISQWGLCIWLTYQPKAFHPTKNLCLKWENFWSIPKFGKQGSKGIHGSRKATPNTTQGLHVPQVI